MVFDEGADDFITAKQQRQWDSVFKRLAPHASWVRRKVAAAFEIDEQALAKARPIASDLPSAHVAAALHKDGNFKELRSDGIFQYARTKAVAYEYQSTHNPGMTLRLAMYLEGIRENHYHIRDTSFIVIYLVSASKISAERHLRVVNDYIKYLLIDIYSTDWAEINDDDIYSKILWSCRSDADNLAIFLNLLEVIERGIFDSRRRTGLRHALMLASLNKPEIANELYRSMPVDPALRNGLKAFLPKLFRDEIKNARKIILEEQFVTALELRGQPLSSAQTRRLKAISLDGLEELNKCVLLGRPADELLNRLESAPLTPTHGAQN